VSLRIGTAIVLATAAAIAARAQLVLPEAPKPAVRHSITGTIMLDRKGGPDERLEVSLAPSNGGGRIDAFADSSGRFSFRDLLPGGYVVTVRAPYGSKYEDGVAHLTIFDGDASTDYTVTVTLRRRDVAGPAEIVGTVAVDPDAAVSKKARGAYERGLAARAKGNSEEAVKRFREALALEPDYRAALNDHGVDLLRLDRAAEAVAPLRRATELGPRAFAPRLNLALALVATKALDDAEREVARALELEPSSTRALCAGGQIALERGHAAEAVDRLSRALAAEDEMAPAAAFLLGRAHEAAGDAPRAVDAYRMVTYLEPVGARADAAHDRLRALGAE
jgi:Flp pilus assembly protein TadD